MALFVPAGAEHRFTAYEQLACSSSSTGPTPAESAPSRSSGTAYECDVIWLHDWDDVKRARIPHYDDPVERRQSASHDAREAAGLSQRELAFPGCSAAYISRIERGERIPSLQVMRELARRTGVSEQALAFGREALDPAVAERVRAVEAAEAARQGRAGPGLPGSLAGGFQGRPHAQRLSSEPIRRGSTPASRPAAGPSRIGRRTRIVHDGT